MRGWAATKLLFPTAGPPRAGGVIDALAQRRSQMVGAVRCTTNLQAMGQGCWPLATGGTIDAELAASITVDSPDLSLPNSFTQNHLRHAPGANIKHATARLSVGCGGGYVCHPVDTGAPESLTLRRRND